MITEDPNSFNEGVQFDQDKNVVFDFSTDNPDDIIKLVNIANTLYVANVAGHDYFLAYEIQSLTGASQEQVGQLNAAKDSLSWKNKIATALKGIKTEIDKRKVKLSQDSGIDYYQDLEYVKQDTIDLVDSIVEKLSGVGPAEFIQKVSEIKNDVMFIEDDTINGQIFGESIKVATRRTPNNSEGQKRAIGAQRIMASFDYVQSSLDAVAAEFDIVAGARASKKPIAQQKQGIMKSGKDNANDLSDYIQKNPTDPDVQQFVKIAGDRLAQIKDQYDDIIVAGTPKAIVNLLLMAAGIQKYVTVPKKAATPNLKISDIFDFAQYAKDKGLNGTIDPKTIMVGQYSNLEKYFQDGIAPYKVGKNKGRAKGFKIRNVLPTLRKYMTLYDLSSITQNNSHVLMVDDTVQTGSTLVSIASGLQSVKVDGFALFATESISLDPMKI